MDLTFRPEARPYVLLLLIAALAGLVGIVTGMTLISQGPFEALALLLLPAAAVALLRSVWVAFAGVLGIVSLLPFAALPVGVSVTPTLLELALLSSFAVVVAVLLIDRRLGMRTSGPLVLVMALVGVTAFAFLLGLGRGYTPQTLHDYAKFVLAIGAFWLTIQLVTDVPAAGRVLRLLVLGASAAGAIGLLLYAGGPGFTQRVLLRLASYGYPGSRIVRFIEDDPGRPMRAVGTSVDPNSFGGLLMVGFVLAAGQLLVRRRAIPVWLAASAATLTGAAMLLTYSRGAWVGAFAGVLLVVLLRRPALILPLGGIGAAAILLGVGGGFVERLWLGFTLQDPATKLRLAEYRNAWAIIRQHPWFGVGFGDAPSIELQTGVSSIYLTVAERAGLVGLAVFLIAASVIAWRGLRQSLALPGTERSDLTLCFTASFVAALTVGLVDHYFFNPQFPYMAALFWTVAGAIAAMTMGATAGPAASRHSLREVSSLGHAARAASAR